MDDILTLVRHPADATSHLLRTPAATLKWRKVAALCGAQPPAALGWQEHHSARLGAVCPTCLTEALAAVVTARIGVLR